MTEDIPYDKDLPYSNREIREKWHEINNKLQEILVQTTTTNGRVRKLEQWQSYVIGFCAAVSIMLFSVLLPIVAAFVK
jgi:hypothetical protein